MNTINEQAKMWHQRRNPGDYVGQAAINAASADRVALIDRLRTTVEVLRAIVDWAGPMQDAPRSSRPEWFDAARAVLARLEKEGLTDV